MFGSKGNKSKETNYMSQVIFPVQVATYTAKSKNNVWKGWYEPLQGNKTEKTRN